MQRTPLDDVSRFGTVTGVWRRNAPNGERKEMRAGVKKHVGRRVCTKRRKCKKFYISVCLYVLPNPCINHVHADKGSLMLPYFSLLTQIVGQILTTSWISVKSWKRSFLFLCSFLMFSPSLSLFKITLLYTDLFSLQEIQLWPFSW